MKRMYKTLSLAIIGIVSVTSAMAQTKDAAENKRIVESRNYIFKAQMASPQSGKSIQLTSEYDLTISGDTVVAYLPYFGRAYSAPIDPSQGGIKFTAVKPAYIVEPIKKGWEISIKPREANDVSQVNLTIFDNGNATLTITSVNRQPITFLGYVYEAKADKKKGF